MRAASAAQRAAGVTGLAADDVECSSVTLREPCPDDPRATGMPCKAAAVP